MPADPLGRNGSDERTFTTRLPRGLAAEHHPARRRTLELLLAESARIDEARREAELLGKAVWGRLDQVLGWWTHGR